MQFGKKQPVTKYLYTKFGIVILLLVTFFLAKSVYERFLIERDMAKRTSEAQLELQELEERQGELKEEVEYLTGDRGIEEEIRSNFDVAKSGEQVVILVGEEDKVVLPTEKKGAGETAKWWQFWR